MFACIIAMSPRSNHVFSLAVDQDRFLEIDRNSKYSHHTAVMFFSKSTDNMMLWRLDVCLLFVAQWIAVASTAILPFSTLIGKKAVGDRIFLH